MVPVCTGDLDATLHIGFPGTMGSLWQQAGRGGRGTRPSVALFIALDSPLDQALVCAPQTMLNREVEAAIVDPHNPHILKHHLAAAAHELPLQRRRPPALKLCDANGRRLTARQLVDHSVNHGQQQPSKRSKLTLRAASTDIIDSRSSTAAAAIQPADARSLALRPGKTRPLVAPAAGGLGLDEYLFGELALAETADELLANGQLQLIPSTDLPSSSSAAAVGVRGSIAESGAESGRAWQQLKYCAKKSPAGKVSIRNMDNTTYKVINGAPGT